MSRAIVLPHAFPDLVLDLKRDGTILGHGGGQLTAALRLPLRATGQPLAAVFPEPLSALLKQLARMAIARRGLSESTFVHLNARYEVRVSASSADRALCVIRCLSSSVLGQGGSGAEGGPQGCTDRNAFWHRLTKAISTAHLRGRAIALAIVHVEGVAEIASLMDSSMADNAIVTALDRVTRNETTAETASWFVGQTGDDELALVVESAVRDTVEMRVLQVCESLSQPVCVGDSTFHLTPSAGVAVLGQDATSEKTLLEYARAAQVETRRSKSSGICFFSDTIKLRSVTRIDFASELRQAMAQGEIGLRYRGRHELASGRLVALVGYLHWTHPTRRNIRPAQFLAAAAATGLATALSRSILEGLQRDFATFKSMLAPGVRISFGALRHHVLDSGFSSDITSLIKHHALPAEQLELRISERSYVAKEIRDWRCFTDRGVRLVVDEVGRKMSSIDRLARAPLAGLQIDRTCATAAQTDAAAKRVTLAVLALAQALDLTPITTAVDTPQQRDSLRAMGWVQGSGDFFGAVPDPSRQATTAAT